MKCDEVRERLSELTEMMLSPEEHSEMIKHLDTCETCRREAEDLAKVLRVMRGMPRKAPDVDLWTQFAPRLDSIRGGEQCESRAEPTGNLSHVFDQIRDGWLIFRSVVEMSTRNKLQYLLRGTG